MHWVAALIRVSDGYGAGTTTYLQVLHGKDLGKIFPGDGLSDHSPVNYVLISVTTAYCTKIGVRQICCSAPTTLLAIYILHNLSKALYNMLTDPRPQ